MVPTIKIACMATAQRFVIQEHTKPDDLHWDLMLECGDILQTYRLGNPPEEILISPATAEKISDHPITFLTYEGPVNDGKGNVKIADFGTYQETESTKSSIKLGLDGKILTGNFLLSHINKNLWQFEMLK